MNKIIVADNQGVSRTGIAKVLSMEDDFRIIAQCQDLQRLEAAVDTFREATVIYERYLHELVQRECEERQENRITKMLRESQLPLEKSLDAFGTAASESATVIWSR